MKKEIVAHRACCCNIGFSPVSRGQKPTESSAGRLFSFRFRRLAPYGGIPARDFAISAMWKDRTLPLSTDHERASSRLPDLPLSLLN